MSKLVTTQQSNFKYNLYGLNNEIILDQGGELIYADSSPIPTVSPFQKEGWNYINNNPQSVNKFNYYYFSNAGYTVRADEIQGQFCIFENNAITTANVNVLLALYAGMDFFNDGRRVYTSTEKIKPGVKYLAYWGRDPGIYPQLPRLEYTLASERNWNPTFNVLTMSVGSDSGYVAETVNNLMSHVGYIDNNGVVVSSLIATKDNINSGGQLVKLSRDIISRLDALIALQEAGGGGTEAPAEDPTQAPAGDPTVPPAGDGTTMP